MFAPGGALDSQTTESQWEAGLGLTPDEFARLCSQFEWRDGRFFDAEGPVDVSRAFDPVSPYISPATPEDARVAVNNLEEANSTVNKKDVGKYLIFFYVRLKTN